MDIFVEVSLILGVATLVAAVMQLLRQPLIIGHIISGLLVGPVVLDLVHSAETIELFSHIGIALLLFVIGLGLNPKVIREVGRVAVLTGLGQITFTASIGFLIALTLGFSPLTAAYIAAGLSFSSTIIILKLLSDKKDLHRLYGKIATGFLLVQDLVAVIALIVVTALGQGQAIGDLLGRTLLGGLLFIVVIALIAHFLLPRISVSLARSQEFLFLFAIGWGFSVAAAAQLIGFSTEIGALVAGVALAGSPYAFEMSSRLRPLRDFFIVLFFIVLGSELQLGLLGAAIVPAVALTILVLIGNPIIVMSIMGLLNFSRKTSFKTSLAVAQISEFSLILLLLGRDVGHIGDEIVAMMTLVMMMTIAASSYLIIYADKVYGWLEPYLQLFERRKTQPERENIKAYEVIIFGFKAGTRSFIENFQAMGKHYLVIDYNPEVTDMLAAESVPHIYGDANDSEFLEELPLDKAKLVVITLTDFATNSLIIGRVLQCNPKAVIIATGEEPHEAQDLYDSGATYVMMPHYLSSNRISTHVARHGLTAHSHFKRIRHEHLNYLQKSAK